MSDNESLSERELEILRLVATGASNKEIARKLNISTNTVKVHLRNIFGKIGAGSRTEAAIYAVNSGLIQNTSPQFSKQNSEPIFIAGISQKKVPNHLYFWGIGILLGLVIVGIVLLRFVNTRGLRLFSNTPGINIIGGIPQPQWKEYPSMPTARSGMATIVYDNQIYTIAGEAKAGITGVLERYDPQTDTWKQLTKKSTPVTDINAAVVGGKIYVPGGRVSSSDTTEVMEIYDPRLDLWSTGAELPLSISAYGLATYEGKIYLFGGWDGTRYHAEVYSYDPERDEWIEKTSMPFERGYVGAVAVNGKIYVMGGTNDEEIQDVNFVYSPEEENIGNNPWQIQSPLPQGRYAIGITSLVDRIYIVGGIGKNGQLLADLEYETLSDIWRQNEVTDFRDWSHLSLAPIGSQIHALGGEIDGSPVNSHLIYQPIYTVLLPIVR